MQQSDSRMRVCHVFVSFHSVLACPGAGGELPSEAMLETYTLNPEPYTLNPEPYTLNPEPYTLNPEPYTLNPEPYT